MRAPDFFHALVILNFLFACGTWALMRPSYRAAASVTVVSGMWLVWNGPIEGEILYSLTTDHGITESDLLSVAGLIVGAVTALRTHRHSVRIARSTNDR